MESTALGCLLLPAAAPLLHTHLHQEEFIEGQATTCQRETVFLLWIMDLHNSFRERHELACAEDRAG